jgi:3-oxoacyl-[acyl-carrier-protein] synthase II
MSRRVVITGASCYTPIGNGMEAIHESFLQNRSGVRYMHEWDEVSGLKSRVAGVVKDFDPNSINRQYRRTMDRVAQMCAKSLEEAIAASGLSEAEINNPKTGISFGSAMGGLETLYEFSSSIYKNSGFKNINATSFLKFMSHTVSANLAVMFNVVGVNIPTCSACTASSQAIGTAYEQIKSGNADIMFCGGGEGLHFVQAGVFDSMAATASSFNDTPTLASRPFDAKREGLVVSEGAGALVLEEYESAKRRGANILAEISGYANNCDGEHITLPSKHGMKLVMQNAMNRAGVSEVGYINAHATATKQGDIAESQAIFELFGDSTPVSSTKGYTGHMFGGGGAIESIITVMALQKSFLPSNMNLQNVGEECAKLDYILAHREKNITTAINNNFAFGGINTCLVFSKI